MLRLPVTLTMMMMPKVDVKYKFDRRIYSASPVSVARSYHTIRHQPLDQSADRSRQTPAITPAIPTIQPTQPSPLSCACHAAMTASQLRNSRTIIRWAGAVSTFEPSARRRIGPTWQSMVPSDRFALCQRGRRRASADRQPRKVSGDRASGGYDAPSAHSYSHHVA
jgi:hypothetical protein